MPDPVRLMNERNFSAARKQYGLRALASNFQRTNAGGVLVTFLSSGGLNSREFSDG